ncbi:unnamed protein product [Kuraishia capsulata CBS 1993]|uniref:Mitochondrial distribution and morphology protein 31 n=1 Tax=Kuraishia capsulata CBS 1993 TaxID=1382522 RepID=W6MF83_9ASCO|nr:uncharacterized protein KUCA_T00000330001 [Kuraishia capsulata CBS 1993]CDK24369.1 unnamed protein product [Kuraishia capsulata CBS 1993]
MMILRSPIRRLARGALAEVGFGLRSRPWVGVTGGLTGNAGMRSTRITCISTSQFRSPIIAQLRWNSHQAGSGEENKHISKKAPDATEQVRGWTTKEEMLRSATNPFSRFYARSKWYLKRSKRPFNTDDFSAFFSWLVAGNMVLLAIGTTTFFSLVLFTINTVFAQELVAQAVGNFLTRNIGLTVVFENAIVPGWREGKISFRKCFVSKRPKGTQQFKKGSQASAAAAAALPPTEKGVEEEADDGNYTQFDLTIEEVNVSLSFSKWFNGKGILKEVEMKGLRGVVDRTHVYWVPGDLATNYKNIHRPGDWEIENFKMEDVLFTLKQPDGFRPFNVSIFSGDLPHFRKNWLFFDILNSNNVSGSYDDSLFTIHKKQRIDDFGSDDIVDGTGTSRVPNWRRVTRLRVDNLNLDHLNAGVEGPFGWITQGTVDMIGDVMVPEEDEPNVAELLKTVADSIAKEARRYRLSPEQQQQRQNPRGSVSDYLVLDFQLRINNPRAAVPLFNGELSYINNALIRPIVGYINSRRTYIPIRCRIVKKVDDFDGSWTIYDSLLMDDLQAEVYDAFVEYVADDTAKVERARKVGFWSLQFLIQVLLWSLGTIA